jgi:sigma-E factor negative regulatory protein RseB
MACDGAHHGHGRGRSRDHPADDVTCILPDQNEVLTGRAPKGQGASPLRQQLPATDFDDRFYRLAIASGAGWSPRERVVMRPTDSFRYGYRLWLDHATAMPLKVQAAGDDGVVVEQLLFSDISLLNAFRIGGAAFRDDRQLHPAAFTAFGTSGQKATESSAWRVESLPPDSACGRFVPALGICEPRWSTRLFGRCRVRIGVHRSVSRRWSRVRPSRVGAANAWTTASGGYLVTAVAKSGATVEAIARSVAGA